MDTIYNIDLPDSQSQLIRDYGLDSFGSW